MAHTSSRLSFCRNVGISFSSSLVTLSSAVVAPERAVAILDLVDEQHQLVELGQLGERLRSEAARPPVEVAASRDGNNSTNGQPSRGRDRLGELVFPVPGGPNRITAFGGWTP